MLETERLVVLPVGLEHAPLQLAYYKRNQAHLAPWEPTWPHDFLTAGYWQAAARRAVDDARADVIHRFVAIERSDPGTMIASVNLSNVVRGVFAAAYLGYSVDGERQGMGLGTEAVGAVVDFAFTELRLHRIMANYQPANERSARLLRRLGFVVEGFARDYLYIGGAWRDHILTAKSNPDGQCVPERTRR